jgi:hypothetical protein
VSGSFWFLNVRHKVFELYAGRCIWPGSHASHHLIQSMACLNKSGDRFLQRNRVLSLDNLYLIFCLMRFCLRPNSAGCPCLSKFFSSSSGPEHYQVAFFYSAIFPGYLSCSHTIVVLL